MTESEIRNLVVSTAQKYLGCKESDGSHRKIIDTYNAHKPLARGYKVTYKDAWCATFVSTVGILCGLTDIMPTECGCGQMVQLYYGLGRWQERDSYTPKKGDIIMYDWDDNGVGDDTGWPEHVGIVASISGNIMQVIEGNINDSVGYRGMRVDGKYIRGYCVPNYASKASKEPAPKPKEPVATVKPTENKAVVDYAASFQKALAGSYKVTASMLNVRSGAGTQKSILTTIPKGTVVQNYGYYTAVNGVKWLSILFTHNGKTYSGFASSKYLKK